MSNPSLSDIIGRRIRGSIGEPWDFRSAAGRGAILGTVTAVYEGEQGPWVLCEIQPFEEDGQEITTVVAAERYRTAEPLGTLAQHARVGVNLFYDPTGAPLEADRVLAFLTAPGEKHFLIGSIELV